jgi:methyl-accepting chemotaxis protein
MPAKRSGVFSLLLPAIVLVPLAGVLLFVMVSSWQEEDSRAALSARATDSLERQKAATEYLSQSPLTWLWVKFQGQRLTLSNRAHEDISLKEIENYGRLLPFAQIFLASENTRTLYKDGAAMKRLTEGDPADSWYFSTLKDDKVLVTREPGQIRTSARVMDDGSVWGAVCLLGPEAAPTPRSALARDRVLWLAGVPAATLLLIVLALVLTSGRRMRATEARLAARDRELHAAAEELARIGASARGAETAAAQLQALAERLGAEAAAAAATGADADALFSRAEARETELRAGIAARLPLLGRLVAVVREAVERARVTETAARVVGTSASRAEEELSRVITFSAASSHAVDKASRAGTVIGEAMDRLSLLTLNAALEAARAAGPAQAFARAADEVKGVAEETAARARALSAALAEAAGSVEGASRAAQEAGRAVHEAAADAARAAGGGWEEVTQLLSQTESANTSAARVKEEALATDRGRSALEGFSRIVARIGSLAAEVAHVAGRAAADAAAITRSVSENSQKGKIS